MNIFSKFKDNIEVIVEELSADGMLPVYAFGTVPVF